MFVSCCVSTNRVKLTDVHLAWVHVQVAKDSAGQLLSSTPAMMARSSGEGNSMNKEAGAWNRDEIEGNLESYVGREAVYTEHFVMIVRLRGATVEDGLVHVQAEVIDGPWGDEGITLPEVDVSTPLDNSYFDRWVWVQPNVPWKLYFDPALVARVRRIVDDPPRDTGPRDLLRTLHRELFRWRPSEERDEELGTDGSQAEFEAYSTRKRPLRVSPCVSVEMKCEGTVPFGPFLSARIRESDDHQRLVLEVVKRKGEDPWEFAWLEGTRWRTNPRKHPKFENYLWSEVRLRPLLMKPPALAEPAQRKKADHPNIETI